MMIGKQHAHTLPDGRLLVIPDVHLDVRWVEGIFKQMAGRWDHCLMLGDYFDSSKRGDAVVTAGEMAVALQRWKTLYGERLHFLLGNHDIPYFEFVPQVQAGVVSPQMNYDCGGFSTIAGREIARVWRAEFMVQFGLFAYCNGCLFSHAGLHPRYWYGEGADLAEALEGLRVRCDIALEYLPLRRVPLLGAGKVRGGEQAIGGITWLDWEAEFEDDPALPRQVVGHSVNTRLGTRFKGRSACLDGGQTCWALIAPDGSLQVQYPAGW